MDKVKRKPTHPGTILKEDYLVPLKISVTEMAEKLGVSRKTLSRILNEKSSITPDMALRLARAFDTTPKLWLNLQQNEEFEAMTELIEDYEYLRVLRDAKEKSRGKKSIPIKDVIAELGL